MYFILLLLFPIASHIIGSLAMNNFAVCGSDGVTYSNIYEWKLRTVLKPDLKLRHLGSCEEQKLYHPHEQLHRMMAADIGNEQLLRSRGKRSRNANSSVMNKLLKAANILHKLAAVPFNFRREDQGQEDKELNELNILTV